MDAYHECLGAILDAQMKVVPYYPHWLRVLNTWLGYP